MDRRSFAVASILICVALTHGDSSQNNSKIVGCNYYYLGNGNNDHLVLRCDSDFTIENNNLFVPNEQSSCPSSGYNFEKHNIGQMGFENCAHPEIPEDLFEIYHNVKYLNVSTLGLTTDELSILLKHHPINLNSLNAAHNHIDEVSNGMLSQFNLLATVNFSFNAIDHFDSNAFSDNNGVEHLDLSHNNLSELNVKAFQRLKEMKRLQLSFNKIAELPSFLFHQTENLIEVDLSFNKIYLIDKYGFSGDFELQKLNLSHNQLTTIPKKAIDNLCSLKDLDISHNSFSRIDKNMFSKPMQLKRLYLSHNKLTAIEENTFVNLERLELIDLSENELKVLYVNIFRGAYLLEFLNIGNNQLTELIGFTASSIPNAKIAGIDLNQINCTHFDQLFDSLQWKQFDAFTKRVMCNNDSASK